MNNLLSELRMITSSLEREDLDSDSAKKLIIEAEILLLKHIGSVKVYDEFMKIREYVDA